jgi:WD40 repeat protein
MNGAVFSPDGRWLATSTYGQGYEVGLWPMTDTYCRVLRGHGGDTAHDIAFAADGSVLYTQGSGDGAILAWDLAAGAGVGPTVVFQTRRQTASGLLADPHGRHLLWFGEQAWKVPLDGTDPIPLEGLPENRPTMSPDGRYLAWSATSPDIVVVVDIEDGERWELDLEGEGGIWGRPSFDVSGRLVATRGGVVSRWDPHIGSTEVLISGIEGAAYPWADEHHLYMSTWTAKDSGHRTVLDLENGTRRRLLPVHFPPSIIALNDSRSIIATGHQDGRIHIGPPHGPSSHLLIGHQGRVTNLRISPGSRWIASTGVDGTIRLWPVPDLSSPPLHELAHDELVTRLKALTNLRAVPDSESHTGYTIEIGPFPGWETVPEW